MERKVSVQLNENSNYNTTHDYFETPNNYSKFSVFKFGLNFFDSYLSWDQTILMTSNNFIY
jgi:hypothetical protein